MLSLMSNTVLLQSVTLVRIFTLNRNQKNRSDSEATIWVLANSYKYSNVCSPN